MPWRLTKMAVEVHKRMLQPSPFPHESCPVLRPGCRQQTVMFSLWWFSTIACTLLPKQLLLKDFKEVWSRRCRSSIRVWGRCSKGIAANLLQSTSCIKWVDRRCGGVKGSLHKKVRTWVKRSMTTSIVSAIWAHVEHSGGWRIGTSMLYVCETWAAMVDLDAEMDGAELTMSEPLRELRRWSGLVPEDADWGGMNRIQGWWMSESPFPLNSGTKTLLF